MPTFSAKRRSPISRSSRSRRILAPNFSWDALICLVCTGQYGRRQTKREFRGGGRRGGARDRVIHVLNGTLTLHLNQAMSPGWRWSRWHSEVLSPPAQLDRSDVAAACPGRTCGPVPGLGQMASPDPADCTAREDNIVWVG